MQVYSTGAPPGSQVVAHLIAPNVGATSGEVLATVVATTNASGVWNFTGEWPPPPGGNADLLSQTQAQSIFGAANTYWQITEPTAQSGLLPNVWNVVVTGAPASSASVSFLSTATAVPVDTGQSRTYG